jgi:hypothetical protein
MLDTETNEKMTKIKTNKKLCQQHIQKTDSRNRMNIFKIFVVTDT